MVLISSQMQMLDHGLVDQMSNGSERHQDNTYFDEEEQYYGGSGGDASVQEPLDDARLQPRMVGPPSTEEGAYFMD